MVDIAKESRFSDLFAIKSMLLTLKSFLNFGHLSTSFLLTRLDACIIKMMD